MTTSSIGMDLAAIMKGKNIPGLVYCVRNVILDFTAQNAKGGLPYELEEHIPLIVDLCNFLEGLESDLKRLKDT